MTTQVLNHKQVAALIKATGHEQTILIEGEAGVGKTALAHEFKTDPFFTNHLIVEPIDCTQLSDGSVWMPDIDRDAGVSRELPNERFGVHKENQRAVPGGVPIVVCLDEIAKARQFIKDVLAPIVYERRIGQFYMPEGSVVFGCTNLSLEGLGDSMQAHLRNRITIVQLRKPTQQEWVRDFAIPKKLSPELIAATEMFPQIFDSFVDYAPGGKYEGKPQHKHNAWIANPTDAGQGQVVTPRSLHAASKIILNCKRAGDVDDDTLQCALNGTVGEAFGRELTSFIRFGRDIPSFERVVADPAGTPLASSPVAKIVQVFQFITQTQTLQQAEAVTEYVQRMPGEMQSLFINSVANSSAIGTFATNRRFGQMLAENRRFFNN
jgi:hypothetical protein